MYLQRLHIIGIGTIANSGAGSYGGGELNIAYFSDTNCKGSIVVTQTYRQNACNPVQGTVDGRYFKSVEARGL